MKLVFMLNKRALASSSVRCCAVCRLSADPWGETKHIVQETLASHLDRCQNAKMRSDRDGLLTRTSTSCVIETEGYGVEYGVPRYSVLFLPRKSYTSVDPPGCLAVRIRNQITQSVLRSRALGPPFPWKSRRNINGAGVDMAGASRQELGWPGRPGHSMSQPGRGNASTWLPRIREVYTHQGSLLYCTQPSV